MKERLTSEGQMSMRQERMLGIAMLVAGLVIVGLSVTQMRPDGVVHAQATQRDDPPAQSMPGGTRPTTPAPEPARPPQNNQQGNEGATTGTSPPNSGDRPPITGTPLPPAPAEKTGPPIQQK